MQPAAQRLPSPLMSSGPTDIQLEVRRLTGGRPGRLVRPWQQRHGSALPLLIKPQACPGRSKVTHWQAKPGRPVGPARANGPTLGRKS